MDLITAEVMIGGDLRNTVFKGAHNPITVPEIDVLRAVHGEDAVKVGEGCGYVKRTARQEKARLSSFYGSKLVDQVYPGINGNGIDVGTDPEKETQPKSRARQGQKDTGAKKAGLV